VINLGLMVKNIYGVSSKKGDDNLLLPRYATLAVSARKDGYIFSLDSEIIYGRYGSEKRKKARFWLLRGGAEKKIGDLLSVRVGLIYPVVADTSTAGDIKDDIPSPRIGGAAGIGVDFDRITLDFAVYGDPARSYVEQKKVFTSVGTITLKF